MQLQELCVPEATPPPRSIKTRLNKSEHGQDWRAVNLRLPPGSTVRNGFSASGWP